MFQNLKFHLLYTKPKWHHYGLTQIFPELLVFWKFEFEVLIQAEVSLKWIKKSTKTWKIFKILTNLAKFQYFEDLWFMKIFFEIGLCFWNNLSNS